MNQTNHDPWNQVNAGLELMTSSGLARWSVFKLRLEAATDSTKFEADAAAVNAKFGRLICWITFSAGVEYLVRGVFSLRGLCPPVPHDYRRPIEEGEDLATWISHMDSGDACVVEAGQKDEMKLGGKLPWDKVLGNATPEETRTVGWGIYLLATTIRNRDFHRYVEGVRLKQFYLVQKLFLPAINIILSDLDQTELKQRGPVDVQTRRK